MSSQKLKLPYAEVMPFAERIVEAITPFCLRVEIAGSLRRRKSEVGDIEIVAIPKRPKNLFGKELTNEPTMLDSFLDSNNVQFNTRGPLMQQFKYGKHTVDLFLPMIPTWGAIMTIRTGSADFSRWLVMSQAAGGACPEGVRFWQGRVFHNMRVLETPEEADVFAALGLAWIEPVDRNGWPSKWDTVEPIRNYSGETETQV